MLRVLLHSDPLPPKLLPTLAIFIAPPAMTGLSWAVLTGHQGDPVFRIFYAATIAFVVLVASQLPAPAHGALRPPVLGLHLPARPQRR